MDHNYTHIHLFSNCNLAKGSVLPVFGMDFEDFDRCVLLYAKVFQISYEFVSIRKGLMILIDFDVFLMFKFS